MIEKDLLILGDCLDVMRSIPNGSVDMVLCDLPYGVLNKGNEGARWDSIIPFQPLWEHYKRIVKDNGAIVLFGTGMFTAKLMLSQPKLWRYNLVWDKVNPTGFLNSNRMPLRVHEDIVVFYKKLPKYHPQMIPYDVSMRHGKGKKFKSHASVNSTNCYGAFTQLDTAMRDERFPVSIIREKRKHDIKRHYHPTEKPVDLLRWLIRTYTDTGDLVLDNAMGSGSTCVAAKIENRHYIGIEKEKLYYDVALKRMESSMKEKTDNI